MNKLLLDLGKSGQKINRKDLVFYSKNLFQEPAARKFFKDIPEFVDFITGEDLY